MSDDLTTTLSRELQERAHAMDGSTLHLADVKGRARSIRRRRTATAVAGVAAAVGLIVPTAALASHTSGKPEPAPITQTPSPTPTETADTGHQPRPGVLDVSDLPTGDAPRMEYLTQGTQLHLIDGSTTDVGSRHRVMGFAALRDGSRVFVTTAGGSPYIEVEKADGSWQAPVRSSTWDLAVNPAHTLAAWVDQDGQVMVWSVGASKPVPLGDPLSSRSEPKMGAIAGDDCSLACTVYVNVTDDQGHLQPWEVTDSGSQVMRDGSYLNVADVSANGLMIGLDQITDSGSCSKLLGGGEFVGFSTCKHTLVSFSPDGRLVLADPAYHDGIGNGEIAMYRAGGGDPLFERHSTENAQAHYPDAVWEDATHVLAPVYQDGTWALVRIASDGTMEYAIPPVPGNDVDDPFVLPTGGMSVGD